MSIEYYLLKIEDIEKVNEAGGKIESILLDKINEPENSVILK